MNKRIYIDANCQVGKRAKIVNNNIPFSIEDFIQDHEKIGIDVSLATSSKAIPYSIVMANNEIINCAKKHKEIIPVATLYPGFEHDINDYKSYLEYLFNSGIKCISIDLSKLFIFMPSLFDKILTFAEEKNLPISVNWDNIEDKEKFFNLLNNYHNLKVFLTNVNWSFKKYIFEYMSENKNIFLGINGFIYQNMIEDVCNKFSSKRLLFSTGYPFYSIGSVKAMVEYADISEEEKDEIAYKNALKLFNINLLCKREYGDNQDAFEKCVDSGISLKTKLNFPIIDAHTHFVSDESITADWIGSYSTIKSLLKSSSKIGIDIIHTSPMDGLLYDGIIGNKVTDIAIQRNSFSIKGYVTANPYYKEDIDLALEKLKDPNYVGVKLYPSKNDYPYDGKLYEPLLEKVSNMGMYFLLHGSIEDAKRILEKYKHLKVLLAHSTQSYDYMDKVIDLLYQYPQLSVDICNRYVTNKAIEYLVTRTGSDRVIFGSDSALLSQTAHIGWLAYSDISYNDKKKIISDNVLKLIKKN